MLLGTQWYSSANGCVSPVRCVPYITSHGGLSGIGEKVAKIQNKKVTLIITNSVIPLHYDTTIRLRFSCFLTENNEIFLLYIIGPVCSDCSKLLFMMTLLFNCKPPFLKLVPSHKSPSNWSKQVRAPLSLCHDFMPLESPDQSFNII